MTLDDFACPCCGENKTTAGFFYKMHNAERLAVMSFLITSGYRCEEHNKAVGGSETSSHLKGEAADISLDNNIERFRIVFALMRVGIDRIGIGEDFIHGDIDGEKPRELIWLY